jgi:NAD(P)-dependent dehydrogenase (short-subunit alcohol dehydrogenase family)
MPGQQGLTALVTGANSGIGFQAAVELPGTAPSC